MRRPKPKESRDASLAEELLCSAKTFVHSKSSTVGLVRFEACPYDSKSKQDPSNQGLFTSPDTERRLIFFRFGIISKLSFRASLDTNTELVMLGKADPKQE